MDSEIAVSIVCTAYNHGKYIRQTLESFVGQKTNFKFEVLIHDDASTDETAEIIREYEEKYPDIIKPIYQTENQYSQSIPINITYQFPRIKGRYVAFCEGDDYWCHPRKLQKQFDIMEKNPDCSMCTHRTVQTYLKGYGKWPCIPWNVVEQEGKIDCEELLRILTISGYPFQTSSFFVRYSVYADYINERPDFAQNTGIGDIPLLLYMASKGWIYFCDDVYSSYQQYADSSWTEKLWTSPETFNKHYEKTIDMYIKYNEYLGGIYSEYTQRICDRIRRRIKNAAIQFEQNTTKYYIE